MDQGQALPNESANLTSSLPPPAMEIGVIPGNEEQRVPLSEMPFGNELLVPISVSVSEDGIDIKDAFTWNLKGTEIKLLGTPSLRIALFTKSK